MWIIFYNEVYMKEYRQPMDGVTRRNDSIKGRRGVASTRPPHPHTTTEWENWIKSTMARMVCVIETFRHFKSILMFYLLLCNWCGTEAVPEQSRDFCFKFNIYFCMYKSVWLRSKVVSRSTSTQSYQSISITNLLWWWNAPHKRTHVYLGIWNMWESEWMGLWKLIAACAWC